MKDKLKPCPFCGSKVKVTISYTIQIGNQGVKEVKFYDVRCLNENCLLNSIGNTKKEVIKKWNRRVK